MEFGKMTVGIEGKAALGEGMQAKAFRLLCICRMWSC